MSQELINENNELKAKVAQSEQNINGLLAQFEAHKQLLNEQLSVGLQLRTNIVLFQKQAQELNGKITEMQHTIDNLNSQLDNKQ